MKKLFLISLLLTKSAFSQPTGGITPENAKELLANSDAFFLGEWDSTNKRNSDLIISEADPQVGGYKLKFFIHRLAYLEGYANNANNGEKLVINQGYSDRNAPNADRPAEIKGELVKDNKGIKFTITNSEDPHLKVGDVYAYEKRGTASIPAEWLMGGFKLYTENKDYPISMYNFGEGGIWSSNDRNFKENASGKFQKVAEGEGFIKYNLLDNEGKFIKEFIFTRNEKGLIIIKFPDDEGVIFYQD